MRYVSIDLETTGLDTQRCQVLQVALVIEDTAVDAPVERLPCFECLVAPYAGRVEGEPYALALNADLLRALDTAPKGGWVVKYRGRNVQVLAHNLWEEDALEWLTKHFGNQRVTVAGKNAAGFDLRFLCYPPLQAKFRHRALDPGSVFVDWTQDQLPSLDELKVSRGVDGPVTHDALEDARDVIRVLRTAYGRAPL